MDARLACPVHVPIWMLALSALVATNVVVAVALLAHYVHERCGSR